MLNLFRFLSKNQPTRRRAPHHAPSALLEGLESRMLMSAAHHSAHALHLSVSQASDTSTSSSTATKTTAAFSTLSATIQAGLEAVAQGVTIGDATLITIRTKDDGTSVYSAVINVDGVKSRIAVDGSGNALEGKIEFSAAATAIQTGLQAQDAAGTIPNTQLVAIHTRRDGTTIFSTTVTLSNVATTIAVDSTGTAVTTTGGNGDCGGTQTTVQFSTLSTAVQTGLSALAQGTTIDATQEIRVLSRSDGTSIYSVVLSINGVNSPIAVDNLGTLLEGKITFSAAPAAVQTGLQSQDTAGTIPDTQLVQISTYHDSSTVYSTSVTLSGTATIIAVDSTGATVTTPTRGDGHGPGGDGFGRGGHGHGGGGDFGGGDSGTSADFSPAAAGGSGFTAAYGGNFGGFSQPV